MCVLVTTPSRVLTLRMRETAYRCGAYLWTAVINVINVSPSVNFRLYSSDDGYHLRFAAAAA
jgi:hypothetical protein